VKITRIVSSHEDWWKASYCLKEIGTEFGADGIKITDHKITTETRTKISIFSLLGVRISLQRF